MNKLTFAKYNVADLDAMVAFFAAVFDARTVQTFSMPDWNEALISISGSDEADFVLVCPKEKPEFSLGNVYGPLGIFVSDVDALVEKCVAAGGSVMKAAYSSEYVPLRIAYIETPEGHQIELLQRL